MCWLDSSSIIVVRVICATQLDLSELCAKGEFRQDLYHRLNVLSLHIPPLRECLDGLEPLALGPKEGLALINGTQVSAAVRPRDGGRVEDKGNSTMKKIHAALSALTLSALALTGAAQDTQHNHGPQLGRVSFETSCEPDADAEPEPDGIADPAFPVRGRD